MDKRQQRRRFRLWHCLEAVCEMESRLEEAGRADPFKRDFRFLRGCMSRVGGMHFDEGELQRLERTIQALLMELKDLFECRVSEDFCAGRN
ncbi:MAG: hypothetical protein V5A74_08675 [Desulfohalobiaceae bacterium]